MFDFTGYFYFILLAIISFLQTTVENKFYYNHILLASLRNIALVKTGINKFNSPKIYNLKEDDPKTDPTANDRPKFEYLQLFEFFDHLGLSEFNSSPPVTSVTDEPVVQSSSSTTNSIPQSVKENQY